MKLTATEIKAAKAKEKAYKISDGGGMYLEIFPNGTKSWQLKYRIGGKEKRVVFGVYQRKSPRVQGRQINVYALHYMLEDYGQPKG